MSNRISDKLNYTYLKRIKRWMECPICHGKMRYIKGEISWFCTTCGYKIKESDYLDDYIFWFCDGCNDYLNAQPGFDRTGTNWTCTKCGFNNDITETNIFGECKFCGTLLEDANAKVCPECKNMRLKNAIVAFGVTSSIMRAISDIHKGNSVDDDDGYDLPLWLDYLFDDEKCEEKGTAIMKCANCGNTDTKMLLDEGDTLFCSRCYHRTSVATGADDSVECPYCHRMRDRKAIYCRYCNDSDWKSSTQKEFTKIDRALKKIGK